MTSATAEDVSATATDASAIVAETSPPAFVGAGNSVKFLCLSLSLIVVATTAPLINGSIHQGPVILF